MVGESSMGEGQVPRSVKRHTVSSAFLSARCDTHCFHEVPAGVSVVNRKRGYAS
jgi:hypothetical protein